MSFGGSPSLPPVKDPTPPPALNDPAVEEARRRELQANAKARGRAATMLADNSGTPSIVRPTLLGSR